MSRTSSDSVKGVLLKDYDTDNSPSLDPFITTASTIVDRVVILAASKGLSLTTTELEIIERWLSAHFYCQSDKPYKSNKTERAEAVYQGETHTNFESTLYGQTALLLDWTGSLNDLQRQRRVSAFWLGKVPADQIDADVRVTS